MYYWFYNDYYFFLNIIRLKTNMGFYLLRIYSKKVLNYIIFSRQYSSVSKNIKKKLNNNNYII